MRPDTRHLWIGYSGALAGVAIVTAFFKLFVTDVNSATVALSFLLIVLLASSASGLGPGVVASVAAMICFNIFFLPPVGTITIHDPQNWAALIVFLATAVIASQLAATARMRAQDAETRREEMSKLYELSRAIIITPDPESAMSLIMRQVVEGFSIAYCSVFALDEDGRWKRVAIATNLDNLPEPVPSQAAILDCYARGEIVMVSDNGIQSFEPLAEAGKTALICAPLKVGVKSIGVMVALAGSLELGTIEAIAGLVALGLERTKFLKEMSRAEALRQSDELKSALLASVSHDLRTPLTSIRAAVDSLMQKEIEWDKTALDDFHQIISEEVERLRRLVNNLLEMARIEGGEIHLSREWGPVSDIVSSVLDRCSGAIQNHKVKIEIDNNLPWIKADSRLIAQALANLVENAAKYSPSGSEIIIRADVNAHELVIDVIDSGSGIKEEERERIFDKFYRGSRTGEAGREGTGMGLAIARGIIEAHGGQIRADDVPGNGAIFSFTVPVEQKEMLNSSIID